MQAVEDRAPGDRGLDDGIEGGAIGDAQRRGGEARIAGQRRQGEHAAQTAELVVVARDDHDPAVAAGIDAAGMGHRIARPGALRGTRPDARWSTAK